MRMTALTLIGLIAVAGGIAAQAQQQAPTNQAPSNATSSTAAMDCTKAPKRHDHGMDKGAGSTVPNPCTQAQAASGPPAKKTHGPRP